MSWLGGGLVRRRFGITLVHCYVWHAYNVAEYGLSEKTLLRPRAVSDKSKQLFCDQERQSYGVSKCNTPQHDGFECRARKVSTVIIKRYLGRHLPGYYVNYTPHEAAKKYLTTRCRCAHQLPWKTQRPREHTFFMSVRGKVLSPTTLKKWCQRPREPISLTNI